MTDYSHERYINPYTDFGFKKLFGTEMNKDLLISFLNSLFYGRQQEITDVEYLNSEVLGESYVDRRAVFDVYCKTADDSRFIVEMQKAEQEYFKDRSIFYASSAIREQSKRGVWNYRLDAVYTVGILNFCFPGEEYPADSYKHEVKLKDTDDNHVFYDKLSFVYLEMPKFRKTEDELLTMEDKWMFALSNLSRLLDRPKALQERVFKRLFDQAEIARFTPKERQAYDESVKVFLDNYNTVETAHKKGIAEGVEKGRAEGLAEGRAEEKLGIARNLKAMGLSVESIARATGLSADEVDSL